MAGAVGEPGVLFRVIGIDAFFAGFRLDAGQYRLGAAQGGQFLQHAPDILLGVLRTQIRFSQQKAGFRQIGDDDVRLAAQLRHVQGELLREAGIQTAVVGHGRIDQDQRVPAAEVREQLRGQVNLFEGTQISGIQRIEMKSFLFPVCADRRDVRGQIPERPAFLECGMGGEHCRRNDRRFHAHGRDDRQGDGQRAFADAGDILN